MTSESYYTARRKLDATNAHLNLLWRGVLALAGLAALALGVAWAV